jgi:hypothetical protein
MTPREVSEVVYQGDHQAGAFSHNPESRVGFDDGSMLVVVFDPDQRVIRAYAEFPRLPFPASAS